MSFRGYKILQLLSYPLLAVLLVLTVLEFYPVLLYGIKHLRAYQWLLYGMAIYFIIRRFGFFSRNEPWLQTTAHEATHALVGLMFFHKIHSLQANESNGVVYHSGRGFGDIFISLAPYCLPVLTYAILIFRLMGATSMLYIFDLLIGFTLAFHILCFGTQTRLDQPDIKGHGCVRSVLFICVSWFFNATIILLSIRKGVFGAFTYIFPQYWHDIVDFWNFIF
jgi:hypothetical protein